jgi:hypothetical protein
MNTGQQNRDWRHQRTAPPPVILLERDGFKLIQSSRSGSLLKHDLFGKPVSAFPDHALATDGESGNRVEQRN